MRPKCLLVLHFSTTITESSNIQWLEDTADNKWRQKTTIGFGINKIVGIKTQNMKSTRMITKYRIEKVKFVSSDW